MADEYLQQQDEVTEADEGMILLLVQPGGTPEESVPKYTTVKNFRVATRIFLKRPGGDYLEISASDDNDSPLQFQILAALP